MRKGWLIVVSLALVVALLGTVGCDNRTAGESHDIGAQPEVTAETVYETVEFTEVEKAKITGLIEKLPQEVRQQFDVKYEAWEATWDDPWLAVQSNPRAWTISTEYKELLDYCKKQGEEVWPLVLERLQQDRCFIVSNLLEDLTLEKYGYILERIREESQQERYTKEGKYIAPSSEANLMKYAKELLALLSQ